MVQLLAADHRPFLPSRLVTGLSTKLTTNAFILEAEQTNEIEYTTFVRLAHLY